MEIGDLERRKGDDTASLGVIPGHTYVTVTQNVEVFRKYQCPRAIEAKDCRTVFL